MNLRANEGIKEISLTKHFTKLLHELEYCSEDEQKQKITEFNGLLDEMGTKEMYSIFTLSIFNRLDKMIEEKKLGMENVIVLLKRMGFNQITKSVLINSFFRSDLHKRFEKMIIDENEKKEGKNEKLLVDLCECYLLFYSGVFSSKMLSLCVPCLLKFALKKEEREKVQKEVEMALLALSCIDVICIIEQRLYLNEIKEIIEYHQKHHKLTRLAYQSAW
ncbi:uncharacterized protein MONOS_420 [Monocercomonoides exilis]|uniref:uncharacterized protein n=1 Tax=Monocercomonoides exilis TaxID=2049356 RepID=UPI0035594AEA|nr:hypothetical protein MONOS_420 [Monocercomonoides exilis]